LTWIKLPIGGAPLMTRLIQVKAAIGT